MEKYHDGKASMVQYMVLTLYTVQVPKSLLAATVTIVFTFHVRGLNAECTSSM